ncbi:MAG TPA: glycosyltransferase family 39 protein [Terriglobales bacterium]|nr:glycosyltransferase family 39 protein [Terriglobales bacterium]
MQANPYLKHNSIVFALIFFVILILHAPLLTLPYFWDEAGHYVPAARDLMLSGDVIPRTTVSNAHPPLPMFYLAAAWSLLGYAPIVTRVAMLLLTAFGLLQVFKIGETVANREVAIGATVCTALYPVIFAQSSLAHADVMATALALWGLRLYLEDRRWSWVAFSLAVLAKETAILFPVVLLGWTVFKWITKDGALPFRKSSFLLSMPGVVLALWFAYHYWRTGFIFGNPEFFRYNVGTTFVPMRIVLAGLRRLWQVTGYMNLWVLTLSMAAAMMLPALKEGDGERPRIAILTQILFLMLVLGHVLGHSLVGGAVLARYMMPAIPLVILICVSTLWRRVAQWKWVVGFACITFVVGWVVPPLTSFSPEDNLNYASYVRVHQKAAAFLEAKYPKARVLTAWPASDEIGHEYLGYVVKPLRTVQIENFSFDQLLLARQSGDYDVALLFSTKTPRHFRWEAWDKANTQYFDLHDDVSPGVAASLLNGRLVMEASENGQWVAVMEFDRIRNGD